MYSEKLLKIKAKKNEIEHMLMLQGKHPHKAYVDRLLADIDTRLSLLNYKRVGVGIQFDVEKFNEDINAIHEDLRILFALVDEMAVEKYVELESFTNGFLLSLENAADRADLKAREELEATTLNADVVYFGTADNLSYDNEVVSVDIGPLEFRPQSKVYGTVAGTGFEPEDIVFEFDGKRISDYNLNGETLKLGGDVDKKVYSYSINEEDGVRGAFKVAVQSLEADESHQYEIYGGCGLMKTSTVKAGENLEELKSGESYFSSVQTTYTFYLTNATYIDLNFTVEPLNKNFSSYTNAGLQRDIYTKYEFTLPAAASFSINTDGVTYATKEEPAVNDGSLYVASNTIAKDFVVIEYVPGDNVSVDTKLYIYNTVEKDLNIKSVAIKEIADIAGGIVK